MNKKTNVVGSFSGCHQCYVPFLKQGCMIWWQV